MNREKSNIQITLKAGILKRICAFLLALLMGMLPCCNIDMSNAIEGVGDESIMDNNGWVIPKNGGTMKIGGHEFHGMRYWIINGRSSYCVQPGTSISTGDKMKQYNPNNFSADKQQLIWYVLYYGNGDAKGSIASYAATQGLIWLIVLDKWGNEAEMNSARNVLEAKCSGAGDKFNEICDKANAIWKIRGKYPSFARKELFGAIPTHTLKYDKTVGKYKVEIKDKNNILKEYDFANANLPQGVTYKINGDKITFYSSLPVNSNAIKIKTKPDSPLALGAGSQGLIFWGEKNENKPRQKQVRYKGNDEDPVDVYFKLNTKPYNPSGGSVEDDITVEYNINVTKSCAETGRGLEGVTFDVYEDDQKVDTIKTDSEGKASYIIEKSSSASATYIENYDELVSKVDATTLAEMLKSFEGAYHSVEEAENYVESQLNAFKEQTHTYKIVETGTRYGYVLHMNHPEDEEIVEQTIAGDETAEFNVIDHRTTTQVKIKKEDLETVTPQGDATLGGAIYGLYAAGDIIHPDGHTGTLYNINDLVSVATTSENGGAEFLYNTEGLWAGKQLLLGQYYIKEISRSEGYEMSITGINYQQTNREDVKQEISLENTGSIMSTALYINGSDEDNDDELYFDVTGKNLTKGYDVTISGLPEGITIYKTGWEKKTVTQNIVIGKEKKLLVDNDGNPVYKKAEVEGFKTDDDGNLIIKLDSNGDPVYSNTPVYETYMIEYEVESTTDTAIEEVVTLDKVENKIIIYKKAIIITNGGIEQEVTYPIAYDEGFFTLNEDGTVTVEGKEIDADAPLDLENPVLKNMHEPEYDTYTIGENLLDKDGNPIQEFEWIDIYEDVTFEQSNETRTPIMTTYDDASQTYKFHVNETGNLGDCFVAVFPEEYSALAFKTQAGVTALTPMQLTNSVAGSYIKYVTLVYQGATKVIEDAGTFLVPIKVQERVIKQAIKITKSISKDSHKNNTYGISEIGKLPDFSFKVYLISDLIDNGLTLNGKGNYDYKKFLQDNPTKEKSLAKKIDKSANDKDGDLKTVHASKNKNEDYWYATTTMLPYGRYVIIEQQSTDMKNKHYEIAQPQEMVIPFVPEENAENKQTPSNKYFYDKNVSLDTMQSQYGIRLGVESDSKYEAGESILHIDQKSFFNRQLVDYDKKFLSALIPWSIVEPSTFVLDGKSYTQDEDFDSFVGYAYSTFENTFYSSKLRIEKIDNETGENIIHHGAYFKIYKAKRDEATGDVLFDSNNVPIYSENDLIQQYDSQGNEVGIFKAFSTEADIMTEDGIKQENVGYIETYELIGAGAYVIVEVKAPIGYATLSKPVAVEIYSDKTTYYPNGETSKKIADKYEYAVPLEPNHKTNVNAITINNIPLKVAIHKVEDGEETLIYEIFGTEQELLARQKQEGIDKVEVAYDSDSKFLGYATVKHTYDTWSENIVNGTETDLNPMTNVKLVYDENKVYKGHGIKYDIYVEKAKLTLYQGLEVEREDNGAFEGIEVVKDSSTGAISKIVATNTGSGTAISKIGMTEDAPKLNIFDIIEKGNQPVNLLFYDLTKVKTTNDKEGNLYLLDSRGNRTCLLDRFTGLAYVIDEQGNTIVYPVNESGEKVVYEHIRVKESSDGSIHIYSEINTEKDENGLPLYYNAGHVTLDKSTWETGNVGKIIARIGMGAYILEETIVPHGQGYIQSQPVGFLIGDTEEEQKIFMEDDFTKIELSKRDLTNKKEISGAAITLYEAERIEDNSNQGYYLEIKKDNDDNKNIYKKWISGEKPHWIDHIPIGNYIMEETIVPYLDGYVKSENVEVIVLEDEKVQQVVMEDDYTALEILKTDSITNKVITGVGLTLYKAELLEDLELDKFGVPILDETKVITDKDGVSISNKKILSWTTVNGENTTHEAIQYNHELAPNMKFYITSAGAMRMNYIPTGFYILEETQTPFKQGYTTAKPMLIKVDDIGHIEKVQSYNMKDYPTTTQFSKVAITGGKEISGAKLSIYQIATVNAINYTTDGATEITESSVDITTDNSIEIVTGDRIEIYIPTGEAIETWVSGKEGVYSKDDNIPSGYEIGDLKPHVIKYLPIGEYMLVEETAPYGVLKSDSVVFTIENTNKMQKVEMVDEIPKGFIEIHKVDGNDTIQNLEGAEFDIINKQTGKVVDTVVTSNDGIAITTEMSIGYINNKGIFVGYDYIIKETKAPEGYIINNQPYEFQFLYKNSNSNLIKYSYKMKNYDSAPKEPENPTPPGNPDEPNGRAKISKQDITDKSELAGATLTVTNENGDIIDEWVSTLQPHFIEDLPAGKYTLTEKIAPQGYTLAESITFTVEKGLVQANVVMYDDYSKTVIAKTDISGKPLEGATLLLTESDGTFIDKWVSVIKPHTVYRLSENKEYILTELKSPSGYVTAKKITFKIKKVNEVQYITMIDEYTKVQISKKDITGSNEIAGARLTIFDKKGKIVDTWVSTKKPYYIEGIPIGKYTLREEKAPHGYTIATDIQFKITDTRKIQKVVMKDDTAKGKVVIKKIDKFTEIPLVGVVFELRNESGRVLETLVTDSKGYAESKLYPIAKFKKGKYDKAITYTLVEIKTMKGYKLDKTKHRFTFQYVNGKTKIIKKKLTIRNAPSNPKLPQTGDDFNKWLFIGIGFIMMGVGAGMIISDKKKDKEIETAREQLRVQLKEIGKDVED